MKTKKLGISMIMLALMTALLSPVYGVFAAEEQTAPVISDADTAAELGLLLGDGNGVDAAYLAKETTRMQAAIISLRLNGHLDEALAYSGTLSFSDADQVGNANQPVLAYLKTHPELGWSGYPDGSFNPSGIISSQQLYKVLLEGIGYRLNSDFSYTETEAFAAMKGLNQTAGIPKLTNAHLATSLVEALSAHTPHGHSFFTELQSREVIDSSAALPQGERIRLRNDDTIGTYLADGKGMTLYYFAKDADDLNACQGNCLVNWPIYHSEQLQVPAYMNVEDFDRLTRPDGSKQWTFKGYPLYYFVKDKAPGDVAGHLVNNVWFAIDPESFTGMTETNAKTYYIDIKEFSFATESLTVEAGSRIVFTNYDDMKHNAVAEDGSFSTPLLAKGETYTITMDNAGTFEYFCEPHKAIMTGQIIVK